MNKENSIARWALIDAENRKCREFTIVDPAGRFDPLLQWLLIPEVLNAFADSAYVEQEGEIVPPTLDYLRDQVKALVTAVRWRRETSGLTLPNGMRILTATEDQDRVNSVLTNMERYAVETVDFKAVSGWVHAAYDDIKAIGAAIMQHVQGCFTAERTHHDAINALLTVEAIATYDYTAGWPLSDLSPAAPDQPADAPAETPVADTSEPTTDNAPTDDEIA